MQDRIAGEIGRIRIEGAKERGRRVRFGVELRQEAGGRAELGVKVKAE